MTACSDGEATQEAQYLAFCILTIGGDQSETVANGCLVSISRNVRRKAECPRRKQLHTVASQVWMHAMGGREGVIDTACKTSETGRDADHVFTKSLLLLSGSSIGMRMRQKPALTWAY